MRRWTRRSGNWEPHTQDTHSAAEGLRRGHQMRPRRRGALGAAQGGVAGVTALVRIAPQPVGANLLTESPRVGVATAAFPSP